MREIGVVSSFVNMHVCKKEDWSDEEDLVLCVCL